MFFFPQAVSYTWVDLRIWEITLIKPLKRWYQCINPRTYTIVTYGLESFGGVSWQPPVSSAPWLGDPRTAGFSRTWSWWHGACKVMLCAATTNQEPCLDGWTGLDWAVHGQEPAYFVFFWNIGWLWRLLMWYYSTPNQYIDHHLKKSSRV